MDNGFTIQEVSERLKLPKSTLRYWEQKLDRLIQPQRTKGGQRRYNQSHVVLFKKILGLKTQGKKIAEIKRILHMEKEVQDGSMMSSEEAVSILSSRIANMVQREVSQFLKHFEQTLP